MGTTPEKGKKTKPDSLICFVCVNRKLTREYSRAEEALRVVNKNNAVRQAVTKTGEHTET